MPKWMLSLFAAILALDLLAAPAMTFAQDDATTEQPADDADDDSGDQPATDEGN